MLLKNYKRCLSFVLALALVLSLIPMSALAAEEDPNGQAPINTAAEVSEPAEETTISTETSEPPSEPEEANRAAVEDIQARINAVLTQYGITAEMSDQEIGNAIIPADGDTIQATMEEMSAIEESALAMTANEFLQLDTELYGRFCSVMDQIFQPATLATKTAVLDGQVSITDTADKNTVSDGTVTIQAKGGMFSKQTNTVTITNETASMATLVFDYSASTYNSFTIAGVSANASGTYSVKLAPGASLTLALKSNSGWSNLTATLKLSNFSLTVATNTYSLAFEFDANYGSISVGGTSYTDGTASAENVPEASGIAVTATTKNNSTFLGWVNTADGKRLSSAASFTLLPDANMTVKAVFISSTSNAWFLVDNQYMYDDLDAAANRDNASKVVLMNSGTLHPNKNDKNETVPYTIPYGVTLLIPHDTADTIITTEPPIIQSTQSVKVYRTLTMASGTSITLNGSMSIAASLTASQTTGHNGLPTGNVSQVKMEEGSSITVGSTGKLYAIGYIYGSGSVEVKSSGTVYECFQLRDFRGGSATSSMNGSRKTYRLFPLMQYYVQNIQVPMTLNAGAVEQGIGAFAISQLFSDPKPTHTTIPFIGSSGMFNITSGKVVKDYAEDTDRLVIEADATLEVNSYEFPIAVQGFTTTLKTADYILPLNHNITVNMKSGSLSINQDLSLLPGAEILIQEGVTCTLGSDTEIIVYDRDNWDTYCGEKLSSSITNTEIKPLLYVAGGSIHSRTWATTPDASVMVNGTVDATNGYLYTTTGGANVYSTGTGKIIGVTAGTLTTVYQATQDSSNITYVEIGVTPAKLKQENGDYLETTGAANTTYNHDHYTCLDHGDTTTDSTVAKCGTWYAGNHATATAAVLPTYQKTGTTEVCTCSHGGDVLPKVVQQAAIAASADSEIILDVKFWLPEEFENDTNATVTVTFRDEEPRTYAVNELAVDNNRYVITQSIASGEMTCPVDITFRSGDGTVVKARSGNAISDSLSKSVVDYAKLVLENGTDQQKALITNLLTYGGYSQVKFGVDADNPAYKLLEEKGIDVPDVANTAISVTESDTVTAVSTITGSITGLTVSEKNQAYLDSAIYFRLYFTLTEGSIKDYSVSYRVPVGNRDTVATSLKIEPDTENNRYYVDIPDIPSGYLDYPYKVTFSKGSETLTVQTSVLAYLKRLVDNGAATTDEKNLAKAMYLYNQAANTFFNK